MGDRVQDRTLSEIGGKGLFTEEIEDGLLGGTLDIAVHSVKDMLTELPDGLTLGAVLPREDPRDAFISASGDTLHALPAGSVIGSASLRRQAQVLALRPDLTVIPFRGNVDTRLEKLRKGEADATLLALAGLNRLGKEEVASEVFETADLLPAVGQGAVGLEIRTEDERISGAVAAIDHQATGLEVAAERALLAELDGSCKTPIAGLARLGEEDRLHLRGLVARPDGSEVHVTEREGLAADGVAMGRDAGRELKALAGPDFLP